MNLDHTENFVKFWKSEFPNVLCPPLPKSPSDLSLGARLVLENWDEGRLHQNLFGNSGRGQNLPADVLLRLNTNSLEPQDAPSLRAANLEHLAQKCEQLGQQQQDQRLVDSVTAGRKQYLEEKKSFDAWGKASFGERLAAAPPTPQSVAAAKKAWGISEG